MRCPNCAARYTSKCLKCGYDPRTGEAKLTLADLGMDRRPHVPMEKSHIWIGNLEDEAAFAEYFDERYPEDDDDDTPFSAFAADQGELAYDPDWIECTYAQTPDVRSLVTGHSYSADYVDAVVAATEERGIRDANTFVLADASQFATPRSVQTEERRLWYLGSFTCSVE